MLKPLSLLVLLVVPARAFASAPAVVVSVKPLHSLVCGVMEGVGTPALIIKGAGSPHTYALKPSDARALEGARVVFWVGPSLETFLAKPLAALAARAEVVEFDRARGVALLRGRAGGPWEGHGDHEDDGEHAREEASVDGHLWLDPANAKAVVTVVAETLSRVDPSNRGRYESNAQRETDRIDALDAEVRARLAAVRGVPFVVFHDAYQYLERRYGLRAVGSVTVSPERRPGARRIAEIRSKVKNLGARCVFSEPQFESSLVTTIVEGTGARRGVLDPEGAALDPGPDAYFTLMRNLGDGLATCAGPTEQVRGAR